MPPKKKFGLLLAPGAGASAESPQLQAIEAAMPPSVVVRRMDFPYRLAGRKAPDRAPVLLRAVFDEAASFTREEQIKPGRLFVGGRSMGGRICSMAAASGLNTAGCLLVSYPLHPPGRPEKLRVDHFPDLRSPCLFISGTRDTFGTPDEIVGHTSAIAGEVEHHWLDGGDHGLKRFDQQVAEASARWINQVLARH